MNDTNIQTKRLLCALSVALIFGLMSITAFAETNSVTGTTPEITARAPDTEGAAHSDSAAAAPAANGQTTTEAENGAVVEIEDEPVPIAPRVSQAPAANSSVKSATTVSKSAAQAKAGTGTKQIDEQDVPLTDAPRTGDGAMPLLFSATAAASLSGLVWLGLNKKRGENDK